MAKPLLLLVGGPSGCGKTTLARTLGDALGIVHLSRDSVKSAIALTEADLHHENSVVVDLKKAAMGGEYGQRAFAVAYETVQVLLAGGASVVMDQAWRRGLSERELEPLLENSRSLLLTAVCPRDVAATREERRGERPGLARFREANEYLYDDWDDFLKLDLDIPQLVVDTTDGYDPRLPDIQAWVWRNAR